MAGWLAVTIVAVVQAALRLASGAVAVWQQHASARANCLVMQTAASSQVVLCDIRPNGAMVLVIPQWQAVSQKTGVTEAKCEGMSEI